MTWLVLAAANLLFPFAAAAVALRFALSPRRGALRGLAGELSERLGGLDVQARAALSGRPVVWVHAASAGEVAAASSLIARLARRPRRPAVLVTTTTAAGRQRAQGLSGAAAARLAPLDSWPSVRRFLRAARPAAVLLVETELWPHLIALSGRSGARLALVNARLSPRSFPRYRLARPLLSPFLSLIARVAAQSEEDAQRWRALGACDVRVTGNLKYDLDSAPDPGPAAARLAELGWGGDPVITAASTHPGEEDAVLRALLVARRAQPRTRLVLAPRHVERSSQAAAAVERAGLRPARWSDRGGAGADVLVLDVLGVLRSLFPLSLASFVGGTLVPVGGHNVLEPALAGCPVLFGPHTEHTAEAARLLESAGAGFCAQDGDALGRLLEGLVAAPERARAQGRLALKTAQSLQGACERTLAYLDDLLDQAGV